ncbi:MAG: hypothetical protein AB8B51_15620 [Sedimentitalea sp.]
MKFVSTLAVLCCLSSPVWAQSQEIRDVCAAQAAAATGYTPGSRGAARLRITGSASFGVTHSTRPRIPSPAFAGRGGEEVRLEKERRAYAVALARCLAR